MQEKGDKLESIFEFQVQIKGHNQREYKDKHQEITLVYICRLILNDI